MARFGPWAAARVRRDLPGYEALHQWSVTEPAEFWGALADYAGIRWHRGWRAVVAEPGRMPGARWFPGGTLNFAEHLLRFDDAGPALICRDETGRRRVVSHAGLREAVGRVAAGLRRLGVGPGDRVAACLPNGPEAVIAMLATTSFGGIWSSCSPDFGLVGLLDRFGQIGPKVLLATDGYWYGGRWFDCQATADALADSFEGLAAAVWVPWGGAAAAGSPPAGWLDWQALAAVHTDFAPVPFPFDQPLAILYSSGTTGPPKCIVHGAGGTLLQHLKEHLLHVDLHPGDRLFYFTTCGWMMWNWLVSGLAAGATLVLYDGSPAWPDAGALWRLAGEEGITVFGTSPRYLASLEQAGAGPGQLAALSALRTILSTGSPLPPGAFDFVYREVKPDVQLASISGGTDIVSCFVLGNPLLPVRRGEIQCAGLGMAVGVYGEDGRPVRHGPGELVCTAPFPSMPLGFWGDGDGSRYRQAYFERFPGVWTHGDLVERTGSGGFLIHGRSDAVLNPGGVRIGTAEIYRVVDALPEVAESLAVGQRQDGDERIVLFVVLQPEHALDDALQSRIRAAIRGSLTPRHVPAVIAAVPGLPRTRSGKLSELAVRAVLHGEPVRNLEALANPEVLAHFRPQPDPGCL